MFQRLLCVLVTAGLVVSFDPDQGSIAWSATLVLVVVLGWLVIDDTVEW